MWRQGSSGKNHAVRMHAVKMRAVRMHADESPPGMKAAGKIQPAAYLPGYTGEDEPCRNDTRRQQPADWECTGGKKFNDRGVC